MRGFTDLIPSISGVGPAPTKLVYTNYDTTALSGANAVSQSISYSAGQPIIVVGMYCQSSTTPSISDTRGLSWSVLGQYKNASASVGQVIVWVATPSTSNSTVITIGGDSFGVTQRVITHQNAGTPILLGGASIGAVSVATPLGMSVNPTSNGSALWLFIADFQATTATITPDAGNVYEQIYQNNASHTAGDMAPVTQPLTSNATVAFTGNTKAATTSTSWIAIEVPLASSGPASYVITASGGSYSLTGGTANLVKSKLITAQGGSYALTGSNAAINKNRSLTAQGGAYALSGSAATILKSRLIVAQGGAYTYSGANATLLRSRLLIASGGAYTYAGAAAAINRNRTLTASGGAYSFTGQPVTITKTGAVAYTLTALGGTYAMTGQPATIKKSKLITAQGGSYSFTGQSATIKRSRLLTAQGGSYALTGSAANLIRNRHLTASGGAYAITGGLANIVVSRVYALTANGGQYVITGAAALLRIVGAQAIDPKFLVRPINRSFSVSTATRSFIAKPINTSFMAVDATTEQPFGRSFTAVDVKRNWIASS